MFQNLKHFRKLEKATLENKWNRARKTMVFCTTLWFSRRENHEKTIVWESNPMARTAKVKKKKLAPFKPHKWPPENPKNHQKCEILRKKSKNKGDSEIEDGPVFLWWRLITHWSKFCQNRVYFEVCFQNGAIFIFSKHFFKLYSKTNEFLLWKKNSLQNSRISVSGGFRVKPPPPPYCRPQYLCGGFQMLTKAYKGWQRPTKTYKACQALPSLRKGLQRLTKAYKGLQRLAKSHKSCQRLSGLGFRV